MTYPVKQVIVVRKDLNMRKGKLGAQVAHASSMFLHRFRVVGDSAINVTLTPEESIWLDTLYPKIVVGCASLEELQELVSRAEELGVPVYSVTDSGFTEFHGVPTLTCASFGPCYLSKFDGLTDHLKIL